MHNCKPAPTPVDTKAKVSTIERSSASGAPLYRSIVGALQYLTLTRPDIQYAVQQMCLHMHAPRDTHWALVKRILRYIRGTTAMGLTLTASPDTSLVAYSDADWAGCPDTRRSTSGYCVYLGPSLISCSSKRQPMVSRSSAEAEYRVVASRSALGYDSYFRSCYVRLPRRRLSTVTTSPRCTPLPTLSITDGRNILSSTFTSSGSTSHLVAFEFYMCPPISSSPML
nr:uncharacterized mitochondrial protein AtMg00810-like [Aegilops tauschii subsp. strangulata]